MPRRGSEGKQTGRGPDQRPFPGRTSDVAVCPVHQLAARQRCQSAGYNFFFSSRRRHTRCSRDWSSDVCSSDLSFWKAHLRSTALRSCRSFGQRPARDRKSTRLNSSHGYISYAVFCLKKKNNNPKHTYMSRRVDITEAQPAVSV